MTDRSSENSGRDLARVIATATASTRPLKESLGERAQECAVHGEYRSSGIRYLGSREVWTLCPDCEEARVAAERRAEAQKQAERAQARLESMLGQAAIPKRFATRSLDNFIATTPGQVHALHLARDFAENFEARAERGDGLIFSGAPGTGKSHLATAIQQYIMPCHASLYITCMGLIRAVRATWGGRDAERSEAEVLREFGTVELLVIDEIGVQSGTDNELSLIFEVLDRRYREMRPTVLLTNQDRAGFKSFVGERVYDRLRETAQWVAFDWESYRPKARQDATSGLVGRGAMPGNDPQFAHSA
jgi:DNA replication protein DnaC